MNDKRIETAVGFILAIIFAVLSASLLLSSLFIIMNYYSSPPSSYSTGFEGLCQNCGKYIGSYSVYYSNVCEDCEAALTEAQSIKTPVYRFGIHGKGKRDTRLY